jgi:hypothetical protein
MREDTTALELNDADLELVSGAVNQITTQVALSSEYTVIGTGIEHSDLHLTAFIENAVSRALAHAGLGTQHRHSHHSCHHRS